jgi:hypothetical protein
VQPIFQRHESIGIVYGRCERIREVTQQLYVVFVKGLVLLLRELVCNVKGSEDEEFGVAQVGDSLLDSLYLFPEILDKPKVIILGDFRPDGEPLVQDFELNDVRIAFHGLPETTALQINKRSAACVFSPLVRILIPFLPPCTAFIRIFRGIEWFKQGVLRAPGRGAALISFLFIALQIYDVLFDVYFTGVVG